MGFGGLGAEDGVLGGDGEGESVEAIEYAEGPCLLLQ